MALDLVSQAERLQAEVAEHKRAIGRHKRRLHDAMGQLAAIRAECERRGIRLILVPPPQPHGEGDALHGRQDSH